MKYEGELCIYQKIYFDDETDNIDEARETIELSEIDDLVPLMNESEQPMFVKLMKVKKVKGE